MRLMPNDQEPEMPSLLEQAQNAAKAAGRFVQAGVSGNKLLVGDQEKERRLTICKGCEFFNKSRVRCAKCGCSLKIKLKLITEDCPDGRW